jgi:hypothetical protein
MRDTAGVLPSIDIFLSLLSILEVAAREALELFGMYDSFNESIDEEEKLFHKVTPSTLFLHPRQEKVKLHRLFIWRSITIIVGLAVVLLILVGTRHLVGTRPRGRR